MKDFYFRDDGEEGNSSKTPRRTPKTVKYASPLSVYLRSTRKKLKALSNLALSFKDNNKMTEEEADTVRLFGIWMMKNLGTQYFFPTKAATVNRLFKMVRDDQTTPPTLCAWRLQAIDYAAATSTLPSSPGRSSSHATTTSTDSSENRACESGVNTYYDSDD